MKLSLSLLPLVCLSSALARADLAYTQSTSSPLTAMMGRGAGQITSKVYVKGSSNRTETQAFGHRTVTIARGASSVIQIDPATKTYTVSNSSAAMAKGMMAGRGKAPAMNISVSTQKIGMDTIRGVKAPHYRINMLMQGQTPRGPQTMKMAMDVWKSGTALPTPAKSGQNAMSSLPEGFKALFGSSGGIKGDLKGMGAALGTVPLRMTISMNGRPLSTTETSGLSTKPLPASLFAVPAGYRAVSGAQFTQMQQAAMQKTMAGMMGR